MKKCPVCGEVIRFKVVPKKTFAVNVMPKEKYLAYMATNPEPENPSGDIGAFCNGCGHELIEFLSLKKNPRRNQDSGSRIASGKAL